MLVALFAACMIASVAAAQSVNVTTKSGTRWRGQVQDRVSMTISERGIEQTLEGTIVRAGSSYLILDTVIAGVSQQKTIFFGDIITMKSASAAAAEPTAEPAKSSDAAPKNSASSSSSSSKASSSDSKVLPEPKSADGKPLGVFFLPLEGMVGVELRYDEIKKIGEEADKYGPGQIIVLQINTNGGMVFESEIIDETIQDIQKRHRVIAWVKKAISAGCSLSMACSEIYFMTEGTAGSVTTLAGDSSLAEGPELTKHIEALVATAKRNGYSEHIARAMKLNKYMCSYDKDPVTGDITWYGDLSGKYVLSDANSNLCFNSSNALHCGFSKGTADTPEQLAKLLDLPKWVEIDDYGRKISKEWLDTADRAKLEIPRLLSQQQYAGTGGGSATERIGKLIRIYEDLIRWIDRAPNIAERQFGLQREPLERQITELRKQLSDMRRNR